MSLSEEHSKRKTKKVQYNCPKCKGKYVDRRTQQEHITLANIEKSTKITKQSYTTKHKCEETLLPEFTQHYSAESDSGNDYLESNVSENDEDDNDPLPEFSKESEDSGDEYSNNNGSENDESDEQDSTTSENDEDSSNIGTDTL
ncbi:4917_t:CDS:1, partial [Ambispora leptoticha]